MTNIAILTGRLTRDPETRQTNGGTSITAITVVTDPPLNVLKAHKNPDGKKKADMTAMATTAVAIS